jgi:phospholipid transport system substrate-binding protein
MRTLRAWMLAAGMGTGLAAAGATASGPATRPPVSPPTGNAGASATAPAARAVIEDALGRVEKILRDAKSTPAEKNAKVRAIAETMIDFETMGRLAMGANWRDLSEAKRNEFNKEFRQHVINTYGHFTDDYTDQDLVVAEDRSEARGDWTVQTKIMGIKDGARQELAKVDYRLRQADGKWKVIDITIEGVSMMANFRAQFQDIMTSGGIDKLLKLLHDKNATGAGEPTGKNK